MKSVKCVNAERCLVKCAHRLPHEPMQSGRYAYQTCLNLRTLMCGENGKGEMLDGTCEELKLCEETVVFEKDGKVFQHRCCLMAPHDGLKHYDPVLLVTVGGERVTVDKDGRDISETWSPWIERSGAEVKVEKGDRVKITMPAREPFPAGWCEGVVLKVDDMGKGRGGLYVELEKDKVSAGWDTGYGYWKQEIDGGTIEVLKKGARNA